MFEARLDQGSVLKKLVDSIKDLANEANWEVDANGIRMQAMDSSHVCIIAFDLDAKKFDKYTCDAPQTFGVNLANLSKILKCSSNDDKITMKLEGPSADELKFAFESGDRTSDFTLKLMQIECEQLGIPDNQEYDVVAEIPSTDYARIVRDLSTIGDNFVVTGTTATDADSAPPSLKFSTSGEIGTASMTLKGGAPTEPSSVRPTGAGNEGTSIAVKEPTVLSFSARYLSSFSKGSALSGSTTISMSKDTPMCVRFAIGDIGSLKYYLAPKIDDDDDEAAVAADDDDEDN
jgi:proliferating cell nuclear antigen